MLKLALTKNPSKRPGAGQLAKVGSQRPMHAPHSAPASPTHPAPGPSRHPAPASPTHPAPASPRHPPRPPQHPYFKLMKSDPNALSNLLDKVSAIGTLPCVLGCARRRGLDLKPSLRCSSPPRVSLLQVGPRSRRSSPNSRRTTKRRAARSPRPRARPSSGTTIVSYRTESAEDARPSRQASDAPPPSPSLVCAWPAPPLHVLQCALADAPGGGHLRGTPHVDCQRRRHHQGKRRRRRRLGGRVRCAGPENSMFCRVSPVCQSHPFSPLSSSYDNWAKPMPQYVPVGQNKKGPVPYVQAPNTSGPLDAAAVGHHTP